jgi:acetyl esterase/lipase
MILFRAELPGHEWPEGVQVVDGVAYGDPPSQGARLDLYRPQGEPPAGRGWPVLVAVHGGGWRGGGRSDYGRSLARLVRHGVAIASIDYQLARPGRPGWPGNLNDVREAVRWVHRHSREFGIDPDRIGLIGASAGAHLALLAAMSEGPDRLPVKAVVDFYGPVDLEALAENGTDTEGPLSLLFGSPPSRAHGLLREASPLRHVRAGIPAVLILHGDDDTHVPPEQSRALASELARAGVPHRFVVVRGARHGFGLEQPRDLVPDILTFLDTAWGSISDKSRIDQ